MIQPAQGSANASVNRRSATYLIGFMGVGKTSVGRLLAQRLGRPFVDLDQLICQRTGQSISELFAAGGEEAFRRSEAEALRAVTEEAAVVAVGGGAPTYPGNLAYMQQSGTVVLLSADAETLIGRLSTPEARVVRPLIAATRGSLAARVAELLEARAAAYAQADLVVDTKARPLDAVVQEIADLLAAQGSAEVVFVEAAVRYAVHLDAGVGGPPAVAARLVSRLLEVFPLLPQGAARLALVTDENVARLHLPRYLEALAQRGVSPVVAVIPPGEAHKTLAQVERVAGVLLRGGIDRGSALLALGGGLVSDLGGFVAATVLRGVPFAAFPTTLLAQADAAIGGKTGVNLPAGKNLIGAFHAPRLVAADLTTLATLPAREIASGLGEVLKHALLLGEAELAHLSAHAAAARAGDPQVLLSLLRGCCQYKALVVAADPQERAPEGGRILLNLGHTLGHALETASAGLTDDLALRHGEAVALGLLAAARVSQRLLGGAAIMDLLLELLPRLGLPVDLDRRLWASPGELAAPVRAALAVDKKRAVQGLRFIALQRPGAAQVLTLSMDELIAVLDPQVQMPAPSLKNRGAACSATDHSEDL